MAPMAVRGFMDIFITNIAGSVLQNFPLKIEFNPSDPDFPTTIGTIIESINVYFYSVRSVGKNP